MTRHAPVTRILMAGAVLLVAAACGPAPDGDAGSPGELAVTNAVIIDGLGGEPVPNGVVVVRDGRIVAAGPASDVPIPDGATIVDAAGGAVMPGLADMHVHMVGGWDGVSTDMLGYRRYLNALLYAGVTTVLDVGNVLPFIQQIRAEVDAGRIPGPRIHMVGPLVDGPVPIWPPISYSTFEASGMRIHADQLAAAGVDALKGYAGLDTEMVDSLVRAARITACRWSSTSAPGATTLPPSSRGSRPGLMPPPVRSQTKRSPQWCETAP